VGPIGADPKGRKEGAVIEVVSNLDGKGIMVEGEGVTEGGNQRLGLGTGGGLDHLLLEAPGALGVALVQGQYLFPLFLLHFFRSLLSLSLPLSLSLFISFLLILFADLVPAGARGAQNLDQTKGRKEEHPNDQGRRPQLLERETRGRKEEQPGDQGRPPLLPPPGLGLDQHLVGQINRVVQIKERRVEEMIRKMMKRVRVSGYREVYRDYYREFL
jgi:hypothetical protein